MVVAAVSIYESKSQLALLPRVLGLDLVAGTANTCLALVCVLVLTIYFAISVKGIGGWLHELFFAPFGSHPLLVPANFLFQMVEYISKTLSHSLRLFGNKAEQRIVQFLITNHP